MKPKIIFKTGFIGVTLLFTLETSKVDFYSVSLSSNLAQDQLCRFWRETVKKHPLRYYSGSFPTSATTGCWP